MICNRKQYCILAFIVLLLMTFSCKGKQNLSTNIQQPTQKTSAVFADANPDFFFTSEEDQKTIQWALEKENPIPFRQIAFDSKYTFLINGIDNNSIGIERFSSDKISHEVFVKDPAVSICIVDDWLFYIDHDRILTRVKKNGSEEIKSNIVCFNAELYKGWIYFSTLEPGSGIHLYRFNLEGTVFAELTKEFVNPGFMIVDSLIYYRLMDETFQSCELDGSGKEILGKIPGWTFIVEKPWVYYINRNEKGQLYRREIEEENSERLTTVSVNDFAIVGNSVFYTSENEAEVEGTNSIWGSNLYKLDIEEDLLEQLTTLSTSHLYGIDNTLFFKVDGRFCKVKINETMYRPIVAIGDYRILSDDYAEPLQEFSLTSAGNFNNSGKIGFHSDSFFWSHPYNGAETLQKICSNSSIQTMCEGCFYDCLNIDNNYLYVKEHTLRYSPDFTSRILRISLANTDEIERETVLDSPVSYLVKDGWMFFSNPAYSTFLRKDLNTGQNYYLSFDQARCINIYGKYLYYLNEDKFIIKVQTDGSNRYVLRNQQSEKVTMDEKYLYYLDDKGFLYRMDLVSNEEQQISNFPIQTFNLTKDWIYYIASSDGVYRIQKNDMQSRGRVLSESCHSIYSYQGSVYCVGQQDCKTYLYQIFSDGTSTKIYPNG